MSRSYTLDLPDDLVDWLESQPDGGRDAIVEAVRERMAFSNPVVIEPELDDIVQQAEPELQSRLRTLGRYPQLVEAVTRGLVTIERAEEMAQEADQRR